MCPTTKVHTDGFIISLSHVVVSSAFRATAFTPVPKEFIVSCLNNYCLIALKPIIMMLLEKSKSILCLISTYAAF